MKNIDIDILLIGKTGTGKSSFINYIFEEELAKTGNFEPVTQEFKTYSKESNQLRINITDSKGLEVQDYETIKNKIIKMIDKRESEVLIIFYCINILNARIEDTEIELLNSINYQLKQPVYILLTNCDDIDSSEMKDRIEKMERFLEEKLDQNTKIFLVCNVDIQKRIGIVKKHGKEEILKNLFTLYFKNRIINIAKIKNIEITNEIFNIYNILKNDKDLFSLFSTVILFRNEVIFKNIYKKIKESLVNLEKIKYKLDIETTEILEKYNFYYNEDRKIDSTLIMEEVLFTLSDNTIIFPFILQKVFMNKFLNDDELSIFMKELSKPFYEKLLKEKLENFSSDDLIKILLKNMMKNKYY